MNLTDNKGPNAETARLTAEAEPSSPPDVANDPWDLPW